jgi:hypothetical protein
VKRAAIVLLTVVVCVALTAMPVWAEAGCAKKCAKSCGVTTCPMNKQAGDKTAGVDGKEHAPGHACDYKGTCAYVTLKVSGIADAETEAKLTKTLGEVKGIVKVYSFDRGTSQASLCYDPTIIKSDDLAKVVSEKGFKAEIVPGSVQSCSGGK